VTSGAGCVGRFGGGATNRGTGTGCSTDSGLGAGAGIGSGRGVYVIREVGVGASSLLMFNALRNV